MLYPSLAHTSRLHHTCVVSSRVFWGWVYLAEGPQGPTLPGVDAPFRFEVELRAA
jgi:hypothetical protein